LPLLSSALKSIENETFGIQLDEKLKRIVASKKSMSGEHVTEQSAMRLGAVYACVQILTKTLAMTPLILYKRVKNGKERATNHPLYNVLRYQATKTMPAFQLKESMMMGNTLSGNSYAFIVKSKLTNQTIGLKYIPHQYCKPQLKNGEIIYTVTEDEKSTDHPFEDILHIPSLGYDGLTGLSPIDVSREIIGNGIATQNFGNSFFRNGAKLSGTFEHPNTLSDPAFERLKKDLNEQYNAANANKTMILEEGMKFNPISITPDQAQFLDTMKFNVGNIARIFGVPPHMIGDLERATFSNIEQQSIEFVMYTMLPWFARWEQFINFKCLNEKEREQGYFVEFMVDYLLRGDSNSRSNMLHLMRQDGVINGNEWRAKENMNEMPDGQGSLYFINGNMTPLSKIGGIENAEE